MDYIKDLGVDSLWLSPFYKDGDLDYGNDVVDHKEIDQKFGNNQDFQALLTALSENSEYHECALENRSRQ